MLQSWIAMKLDGYKSYKTCPTFTSECQYKRQGPLNLPPVKHFTKQIWTAKKNACVAVFGLCSHRLYLNRNLENPLSIKPLFTDAISVAIILSNCDMPNPRFLSLFPWLEIKWSLVACLGVTITEDSSPVVCIIQNRDLKCFDILIENVFLADMFHAMESIKAPWWGCYDWPRPRLNITTESSPVRAFQCRVIKSWYNMI